MATLDSLKEALTQKATATASSDRQPLSDTQHSAGFDILLGSGWSTYQDFIIPQLSQLLGPLFNSRVHISALEIGPGPKSVLGYLPGHLRQKGPPKLYGLACDSIVGAVVVSVVSSQALCIGRVPNRHRPAGAVRPENKTDLLWVIKGAGTNVGLVVSVVFKAYVALTYSTRNWVVPLSDSLEAQLRLKYFDHFVARYLPQNWSADAYLYWDGQLQLGVTMFESAASGRLAHLKHSSDPHNVLACPLPKAPMEPKLIVLVTGESCAGKDHCADIWVPVFRTCTHKSLTARAVRISDATKLRAQACIAYIVFDVQRFREEDRDGPGFDAPKHVGGGGRCAWYGGDALCGTMAIT